MEKIYEVDKWKRIYFKKEYIGKKLLLEELGSQLEYNLIKKLVISYGNNGGYCYVKGNSIGKKFKIREIL